MFNNEKSNEKLPFVVENVQSYIKYVLDERIAAQDVDIIYRGHACVSWVLKPSIGRQKYNPEMEKRLFYHFKRQYYSYTNERPETDMDLLCLAQHYGLPTRLLDWTYNPMIALYFACEEEKYDEHDGHVYSYMLTKDLLMDSEVNPNAPKSLKDIFDMKRAMFIVPNYTDIRYKNQKALFLLDNKPEKRFTFPGPAKYLIKKNCKSQIRHELALLGYDRTLVYPMLDSLCSDIKAKNNIV